jgi:hypothetical protein
MLCMNVCGGQGFVLMFVSACKNRKYNAACSRVATDR